MDKEKEVLELIKTKGLSAIHKALINSSRDYEEYIQEFNLRKFSIFRAEDAYTKDEYSLLKAVL